MGNRSLENGGGIYNNGTVYLRGGTIEGNSAAAGGGIFSNKVLTLGGGLIKDNVADSNTSQNVEVRPSESMATFTITGGTISGKSNTSVRIYGEQASMSMSGGGIDGEIVSSQNGKIGISGGYFGIKPNSTWLNDKHSAVTNNNENSYYPTAKYPYMVILQNNIEKKDGFIKITLSNGSEIPIEDSDFTSDSIISGATYTLMGNVQLIHGIVIPENVTIVLDLNGFILRGTGETTVITNNGDLTLKDSNPSAAHKYTKNSEGLYTWNDSTGSITLNGGAITGGNGKFGGGINNNGTFTMENGVITGNTAYHGGGVYNSGVFNMKGGSIVGNLSKNDGGGVNNESGGEVNINGGNISDNTANGDGGGINNDGDLDINGGNIDNNTAGGNGGGINTGESGITNIEGGNITGNESENEGGGVNTENGGNTNFEGGNISGNTTGNGDDSNISGDKDDHIGDNDILVTTPNGNSTYIKIEELGTILIDGATYKLLDNIQLVKDMTVPKKTAVVLDLNGFVLKGTGKNSVITNNGTLTIIDSDSDAIHKYTKGIPYIYGREYTWDDINGTVELAGGYSSSDGGGGIDNYGELTIKAGNIAGNKAYYNGGGINNNSSGKLTLEGGSVSYNLSCFGDGGGGVFNAGVFTMENGIISGNTSDNGGSGVYNTGNFTVNTGGIAGTIKDTSRSVSITGGYFDEYAKNSIDNAWLNGADFISNDGSNKLYPTKNFPHKLNDSPYVGRTTANGVTSYITALRDFCELDSNGATYKLLQNVKLVDGPLEIPYGITATLDLNGFVLTRQGGSFHRIINNNGNLTIIDTNPSAIHKYTKALSGLYTLDDKNGTIELAGGAITGGYEEYDPNRGGGSGGGVYNCGTITMNGGVIVGNTGFNGGGVNTYRGTFTLNDGSIVGNISTGKGSGGGVYNDGGTFSEGSTFIMNGGSIVNNRTENKGGGVCDYHGTIIMHGGLIANNKATKFGGGVSAGPSFTITGGDIVDNTANIGGGVYNSGTNNTLRMEGGNISRNTAEQFAGGVYNNDGTFILISGTIEANKAAEIGGGVYNSGSTFIMEGGSILDNVADKARGVMLETTCTFTMSGGGITGDIHATGTSTYTITSGYFGDDTKNSINQEWLGNRRLIENSGGNPLYPKDKYSYMMK